MYPRQFVLFVSSLCFEFYEVACEVKSGRFDVNLIVANMSSFLGHTQKYEPRFQNS